MKRILITLLAIPCLARGICAQGVRVASTKVDTVRRLSIDSDTAFHPIDLQRAIQLAQRNAPAAVQARGQIRTANSQVRAAYAAFIPGVTITAGQSNQTGDRIGQSCNIVPRNGTRVRNSRHFTICTVAPYRNMQTGPLLIPTAHFNCRGNLRQVLIEPI